MIVALLFVVGATSVNGSSPNVFVAILKLLIIVVSRFTWNVAVIVPDPKVSVLAWVAVTVVLPAFPVIVTTFPSNVASSLSEREYVKAPVLFDVGATNVKGSSTTVLVGTLKPLIVGAPRL